MVPETKLWMEGRRKGKIERESGNKKGKEKKTALYKIIVAAGSSCEGLRDI